VRCVALTFQLIGWVALSIGCVPLALPVGNAERFTILRCTQALFSQHIAGLAKFCLAAAAVH
jgi:hypothetical protein